MPKNNNPDKSKITLNPFQSLETKEKSRDAAKAGCIVAIFLLLSYLVQTGMVYVTGHDTFGNQGMAIVIANGSGAVLAGFLAWRIWFCQPLWAPIVIGIWYILELAIKIHFIANGMQKANIGWAIIFLALLVSTILSIRGSWNLKAFNRDESQKENNIHNKFFYFLFSKKVVITVFALTSIGLLIIFVIGEKIFVALLSFTFFSLAILEEKSNLLAVKILSRTIISLLYAFIIIILIYITWLYIYYDVYEPYQERSRHHYDYLSQEELESTLKNLSDEELEAIVCRNVAEKILYRVSSDRFSREDIPIPSYSKFTDQEIHIALSKLTATESNSVLYQMTTDELKSVNECMTWKVGGW